MKHALRRPATPPSEEIFGESQRRATEMAALAEVGREISATLELTTCSNASSSGPRPSRWNSSAVFLAKAGQRVPGHRCLGDIAEQVKPMRSRSGTGIIGTLAAEARPEIINDVKRTRAPSRSPGTPHDETERLMVAPLIGREGVNGMMAVWRTGPVTARSRRRPRLPGRPFAAGGHRNRQRPALRRAARGARGGRSGEPGQELLPGRDEPRDPHADERDHRHERPAADTQAQRRAARLRRHDPLVGRRAADDHQRHPRLLEDRGGQGRPGGGAVQRRRLHRGRARCDRAGRRRRRASSSPTRSRATCPGGRRRPRPAAPDPAQPAVERDQVHRARRGRRLRRAATTVSAAGRAARSRSATPASASPPTRWAACSSRSARPIRRLRGATAAPALAWPSAAAWRRRWTARSPPRARACRVKVDLPT